jgi:murein DD-endopeptidase MepM/ murein hydrolase activator NlpD
MLALAIGCARASAPVDPDPVPAPAPPTSAVEAEYFEERPLMVPVQGIRPRDLRDSFNDARGGGRTHQALDILAPRGTPVVAAIDGEVLRLTQNSAGGLTIYLTDAERRYIYYYAHLDRYSDEILQTVRVKQGLVIGYVGTSGNAPPDTPHLHFQVMRLSPGQQDWWNGTPVDVRTHMTIPGRARQ